MNPLLYLHVLFEASPARPSFPGRSSSVPAPASDPGPKSPSLLSGAEALVCSVADLPEVLRGLSAKDRSPFAVLLDHLPRPVAAARLAHRAFPEASILFVLPGSESPALKRELALVSLVGAHRTLAAGDPSALRLGLEEAKRLFEKRRALRTTLDRANLRLAHPVPDPVQYRNLILADRHLAALLNQASDAILALDRSGRILGWNRGAERIFQVTAGEATGRLLADFIEEGDRDRAETLLREEGSASGEGKAGAEFLFLRRGDTAFTGEISLARMDEGEAPSLGFSAIIRDISDRKHLEEELRQSQKMEAVGKLAGGIAHDFNNLLTAIIGYSEIVLEKIPAEGQPAEFIREIRSAGERAAALTRQLLAFSRKQILAPRILDLNQVVENTASLLRRLIGEHIELRLRLDPALGAVRADPVQMEQVLLNLAINARDAMPEGGRLLIETRNELLEESQPGMAAEMAADRIPGPQIVLSVTDTGTGMSPEIRSRIFEPFFTTKGVGKGTGLGLSSVFGIVRQSGGSIHVESELGRGSTFRIALPRAERETAPR